MPKVSNVTNSNDPQLINSRVFVGNLNTFVVTKEDVERIFKRYGRIYGISMHKGYTFVQFCNEYDARNAVAGEEGRIVAGQTLDVNMASEPKPNRPGRSNTTAGGGGGVAEWDYFYDTGYSHTARPMPGPPMKRGRSDALTVRRELVPVRQKGKAGQQSKESTDELFVQYNVADVLICGNCKEQFDNLEDMLVHRQATCKFRFACKCQEIEEKAALEVGPFHCASCNEEFPDLYDALFHAQTFHNVKVVEEELIEKKKPEEQEENIGDGTGNHEGETAIDSHNVGEAGDGNEGQGEFANDGDEEMAVQDDTGVEAVDVA